MLVGGEGCYPYPFPILKHMFSYPRNVFIYSGSSVHVSICDVQIELLLKDALKLPFTPSPEPASPLRRSSRRPPLHDYLSGMRPAASERQKP